MKGRIAALVALIVVVGLVLAGAGWWYVKDHQRIGVVDLQNDVVSKTGGTKATCVKTDSNGAHWLCVVKGGSSGQCMKAHVRPWGSVSVIKAYQKCSNVPALEPLLTKPKASTGGGSSSGSS
jgi:hypothetical protein